MAWVDLSAAFSYGSKLTSAQMQNLRDNLTALANGDSGAPQIQTAAIANGAVTYGKLAYNAGNIQWHTTTGTIGYYECLGADGTWRQCSSQFDSSGGGS